MSDNFSHQTQPVMNTSVVAQFVIDGLLDPSPKLTKRLWRELLTSIRARLSARKDLFVFYTIDGTKLIVPFSHDLSIYRAKNSLYAENIGRIARSVFMKYPDLTIIDIGANIGDTTAILRANVPCPILCLEGDQYFSFILRENVRRAEFERVEIEQVFLAGFSGKMAGTAIDRAGTVRLEEIGDREFEVRRLSDVLSLRDDYAKSKLVKLDTDGMDCTILRAEMDWLSSVRPVIFFEYVPTFFKQHAYDGSRIFGDLATIGYKQALFFEPSGEFLASVQIEGEESLFEDFHAFFSNHRYADVCLTHEEDSDLAVEIRNNEIRQPRSRIG